MLAERLPLLITGVAGVAGYNAFRHFHKQFPGQVYGLRPKVTWRLEGEGILECDLEDHARVAELFDQYQFRSVLHCGGSCALKSCELDPWMAYRVNVVAVDARVVETVDAHREAEQGDDGNVVAAREDEHD